MQFIQYTEDLGEERGSGKRLTRTVYVAVADIAYVHIHDQSTKAEIYPKVGIKHTLYEKSDIDNLKAFLHTGRAQS